MKTSGRAAVGILLSLAGSAFAQAPAGPAASTSSGQAYPAKPVRILVGFAPGGGDKSAAPGGGRLFREH